MKKLLGAAAVLLLLCVAGCADPNRDACEGFIGRADNYLASVRDHLKAGDTAVAQSLMRKLPDSLGEYADKATGEPQKAMDVFTLAVVSFNGGATPDLAGALDRVRAACHQ